MIDKSLRMNLLYDFYGQLLTERQRELFEMYYSDDLSLGEIAEQLGVSRQAVYDILRRSVLSLEKFEAELGLVSRHSRTAETLSRILSEIEKLEEDVPLQAESGRDSRALAQYVVECLKRVRAELERALAI